MSTRKIVVTGGAGYIGSMLVSELLRAGIRVSVVDDLWFGGESVAPFLHFDGFELHKRDICRPDALDGLLDGVECTVHLAALVGFPACDAAGRDRVWAVNVTGTQNVHRAAVHAGVKRLIFASSYSNYGESRDGEPVTEESPLYPKSTYAESKIAAERFLLDRSGGDPAVTCLRLATVFGCSPRTRFDLMVNQFVLDAYVGKTLTLFQQDFKRSFVHVRDVARAICRVMEAPVDTVRGEVFNIGSERLNTSKTELAEAVRKQAPSLLLDFRESGSDSDMRSIHVSFEKARRILGFEAHTSLEQGIEELLHVLRDGIVADPFSARYRNHVSTVS